MPNQPSDRKFRILAELGEETEGETLLQTMEQLDQYTVTAPSENSTDELIAFLKPILQKQPSLAQEGIKVTPTPLGTERHRKLLAVLQLVQPQAMLLSRWFVLVSVLVLIVGLAFTKAVNGNMLRFLANASPVLGILTVFYEFRAKLSGTSELEAACPYSPAQLAAARLIVVLGYDTLLCMVATPFVSYYQGQMLWRVIVSWLAPLLLVLGIALAVSLRLGIVGGCLIATTVWALQLVVSEGGLAGLLIPEQMVILVDFIIMGVGVLLLLYAYHCWKSDSVPFSGEPSD